MTQPPYDSETLARIIADGDDKWAQLAATGQTPNLKDTGYVPGTFDESNDNRNKRRKSDS